MNKTLLLSCVFLYLANSCYAVRPHLVFIVADDLGWNDVGWHNPDIKTPNLNKLAHAGVILNSSYVQPVCSPSRNAFMTGFYPYHTGLQHGIISSTSSKHVPGNFTLLPEKLKELGYATHIVGKWHLGYCKWAYTPTYRGFDTFMGYYGGGEGYYSHTAGRRYDFRINKNVYHPPAGEYSTHTFAKRAIHIISTHDKSKPLYLYLPFQAVHNPLEVPKEYENMYSSITDSNRRIYSGMMSALDEAVGNITHALEHYGFMNNTLIVFTSDNGADVSSGGNNMPLRGAKGTIWEGGTRAPGFVYSKTLIKQKGYTSSAMMHAVDWFPTLLSAAGGTPDPGMDGVNQWPTLSNKAASARTEFIYNIDDVTGHAGIRMGNYKLVVGGAGAKNDWYQIGHTTRSLDRRQQHHGPHGPGANQQHGQHQHRDFLFNIHDDPTEHSPLHRHDDIVTKMKQRLEEYKKTLVPSQSMEEHFQTHSGNLNPGWC